MYVFCSFVSRRSNLRRWMRKKRGSWWLERNFFICQRNKNRRRDRAEVAGGEKCNYIFARMRCKQLLGSDRLEAIREWYKETFNFAYNLENGFSPKQTKVIHGKVWAEAGAMTQRVESYMFGASLIHANIAPNEITFASPHARKMESFLLLLFFWSVLVLVMIKSKTKESTTRRDFCNNNKNLKRGWCEEGRVNSTFGPSREAKCPFDSGKN